MFLALIHFEERYLKPCGLAVLLVFAISAIVALCIRKYKIRKYKKSIGPKTPKLVSVKINGNEINPKLLLTAIALLGVSGFVFLALKRYNKKK